MISAPTTETQMMDFSANATGESDTPMTSGSNEAGTFPAIEVTMQGQQEDMAMADAHGSAAQEVIDDGLGQASHADGQDNSSVIYSTFGQPYDSITLNRQGFRLNVDIMAARSQKWQVAVRMNGESIDTRNARQHGPDGGKQFNQSNGNLLDVQGTLINVSKRKDIQSAGSIEEHESTVERQAVRRKLNNGEPMERISHSNA